MLPVALLLIIATVAGAAAWRASAAVERRVSDRRAMAEVAEEIREHTRVRSFVESRLDAEVATGLALTLALLVFTVAGVIVSLLALLVRRSEALSDLDAAAARWAHEHTSTLGHDILSGISLLASTEGVIVIGLVAADHRDDPRSEPLDPASS